MDFLNNSFYLLTHNFRFKQAGQKSSHVVWPLEDAENDNSHNVNIQKNHF